MIPKRVPRYLKKTKNRKLTYTNQRGNIRGLWMRIGQTPPIGNQWGVRLLTQRSSHLVAFKEAIMGSPPTKEAEWTVSTEASREALAPATSTGYRQPQQK